MIEDRILAALPGTVAEIWRATDAPADILDEVLAELVENGSITCVDGVYTRTWVEWPIA